MISESPLKVFFCDESIAACEQLGGELNTIPGLNMCGFTRTVALSLTAIREFQPDVVIADLTFPDGHGLELLHQLRDENQETTVIIRSAQPAAAMREVCIAAGASFYCEKEGPVARLVELMESLAVCRSLLRRNRRRWRFVQLALGTLDQGLAIAEPEGTILWSSPAYNRLLGFSSADAAGRPHPLLQDKADGAMRACLAAGHPWQVEQTEKRHAGPDFQAQHYVTPIRTAPGNQIQFVCALREANAAPAPNDAFGSGSSLLNQAHDYVFQSDLAGNVTYWNHPAETLFGPFSVGIEHPLLARRCATDDQDQLAAALVLARANTWRGELCLHNDRSRTAHRLDLRISGLRDPQGKIYALLHIGRTVVEPRGSDEARLHSQHMESIGTLTTGIVHDMNNTLSPIALAAGVLRYTATDSKSRESVRLIVDCVERGRQLIRQVLHYARNVGQETELVSLADLIAEIAGLARHTFPSTVRVDEDVEAGLLLIKGINSQLHQVFLNLAINARDAMPQGGTLRLSAKNLTLNRDDLERHEGAVPGRWVAVRVSDTGMGIPPDVLPHIWERFFTTKPRDHGTGLGLPTVRSLVESHHGFIRVATEVGQGTTFTVYLPAAPRPAPIVGAARDGGGRGVLIITGDVSEGGPMVQIFRGANFRAHWAGDAATALELCRLHYLTLGLLVLDLDDAPLEATALRHKVCELLPNLPVLQVGGPTAAAGADPVLAKPLQAETLLEHAYQLLPVETPVSR